MSDLSEFLLARIAEDEEWAPAMSCTCADGPGSFGRHLLPSCPTRVLAECEAKRRIVGNYAGTVSALSLAQPDDPRRRVVEEVAESHLLDVKALALPYADHPDFRDEWRL